MKSKAYTRLRTHKHRDKLIPVNGVGEKRADPNLNRDGGASLIEKVRYSMEYATADARETNAAGRPGKLNVNFAVSDNTVVVGSANRTEYAFGRNIEIGLTVGDAAMADAIHDHFRDVHAPGKLERLRLGGVP